MATQRRTNALARQLREEVRRGITPDEALLEPGRRRLRRREFRVRRVRTGNLATSER